MLTIKSPVLILVCILSFSLHAPSQISNNTFSKKIYVPAKEIRVDSLLRIFASQTGVEFSFNSNKISPAKKISVINHTQTLNQWLNSLNQTLGIQHKVVGNHIILIDIDKSVTSKPVANAPTKKEASPGSIGGTVVVAKESAVEPGVEKQQNGSGKTSGSANAKADINQQKPVAGTNTTKSVLVVGKLDSIVKTQAIHLKGSMIQLPTEVAPEEKTKNRSINFIGGYGIHRPASGRIHGWTYGTEYTVYYTEKLSVTYNFRGDIYSWRHLIRYDNGANVTDASIRFTTAGFQLGANGGISLIQRKRHELMIKLGAFGRYQSASNGSDSYTVYYPPTSGLQAVVVAYNNMTQQETLALGAVLQLQYNFTFKSNVFIGAQPSLQTDSNKDPIVQVSFVIGKRF